MTINDKSRNEKLEYDFNREIATKLPLLSDKIDKYEYLTVDEILPPSHKIVMQKTQFTYSALGKTLEKQVKTGPDQGRKQIKALEDKGKQLVKSNEINKKDINTERYSIPLKEQKNI